MRRLVVLAVAAAAGVLWVGVRGAGYIVDVLEGERSW